MNLIDSLIRTVAPEAGLRRARARAALAVVDKIATRSNAYEGAKTGRRTQGWTTAGASANSAMLADLDRLRDRSRDLVRNNPYARKAVTTIRRHMVRTGIQAVFDNKSAQKAWSMWMTECDYRGQLDFYGLQAQIVQVWEEAGEGLIRKRLSKSSSGLLVPYQLEVLEPDYLASWKTQALQDGFIIAGVEFDLFGRRRAYWLYPQHPGESLPIARQLTPVRIAADEIIHFYSVDRPGQVRGVPHLATSMLRLRDLDEYQEALLVQKKIQACFAVFVQNSNAASSLAGAGNTDTTSGKRVETLAPGMVEYLNEGEEIQFASPQQGPDGAYTVEQLHAIAAGAEVMYEQITGDLSRVNYSSIRAGRQEFHALIEQKQWLELIPMVLTPIAKDFAKYGYIAGAVRVQGALPSWTCPRPEFVDPLKDIQAIKEAVRGGLKSLSEGIRQSGYDPAAVFDEIKSERERLKADGIVVDTDAAVTEATTPAAAPPATDLGN